MANVLETGLPSEASTPEWLSPTVEKLSALLVLPPNWDSYGARSVDPQIALAALKLLGHVMRIDSPPPSVVPTCVGGIQFEWHIRGVDLEVAVVSAHDSKVSYEDDSESWEKELSTDLSPPSNVIARLSAFD